jgi:hypothetical protein
VRSTPFARARRRPAVSGPTTEPPRGGRDDEREKAKPSARKNDPLASRPPLESTERRAQSTGTRARGPRSHEKPSQARRAQSTEHRAQSTEHRRAGRGAAINRPGQGASASAEGPQAARRPRRIPENPDKHRMKNAGDEKPGRAPADGSGPAQGKAELRTDRQDDGPRTWRRPRRTPARTAITVRARETRQQTVPSNTPSAGRPGEPETRAT